MGTDIHSFVEYANTPSGESFRGESAHPACLFAEFSISRNYELFDALANARSGQLGEGQASKGALFPPRGIPTDLSYRAAQSYFDLVKDTAVNSSFWPQEGLVSQYEAIGRINSGEAHGGTVLHPFGKSQMCQTVSKPFWHTPSWLFPYEVDAALQHFGLTGALHFDFRLLLEAMKMLEAEVGVGRVRLVFWFDN
jgi:hypothetical protein